MDTRLKNFKYSLFAKIILFLLTIVFFTGAILSFVETTRSIDGDLGVIFSKDFVLERNLKDKNDSFLADITYMATDLKGEDYIRSMADKDEDLNYNLIFRYEDLADLYNQDFNEALSEKENIANFEKKYSEKLKEAREAYIRDRINELNRIKNNLNNKEGFNYYLKYEGREYTNNPNFNFKKGFKYIIFDKDGMDTNYDMAAYKIDDVTNYLPNFYDNIDNKFYMSVDKDVYMREYNKWDSIREKGQALFFQGIVLTIITIIFFLFLASVIGRKSYDDPKIYYSYISRIYNEILFFASLVVIVLWVIFVTGFYAANSNNTVIGLVTAILGTIGLILVLGIVKDVKNGSLFTNTIIYKIFDLVRVFLVTIFAGGSLEKKVLYRILAYPLVFFILAFLSLVLGIGLFGYIPTSVIFFWQPLIVLIFIYRVMREIKDYVKIKEGVQNIKNGDLGHKIYIDRDGELKDLANNINTISEGLDKAIDNELKSERHKTELITNVSHDIRTPLTSIISYIDLLKIETDEKKRREYIEVLDHKSTRLKNLIDDLFEASKVSSGNIPVDLVRIDLVSLVNQALGELNDRIEESNLDFIIKSESESIFVLGDGKHLWRAIENLFSNVFKYALEGSRVYIDIYEDNDYAYFIMKNISKYELNISEEELMERFKRGDKSRTSEGSGLGLSIAESLLAIQGGEFKIEIDGDLFKSQVKLAKYK